MEDLDEAVDALANIWSGRIWPQLEELFALRPDQLVELLKIAPSDTSGVLRLSSPTEAAMEVGASQVPSFETSNGANAIAEALMESRSVFPKMARVTRRVRGKAAG